MKWDRSTPRSRLAAGGLANGAVCQFRTPAPQQLTLSNGGLGVSMRAHSGWSGRVQVGSPPEVEIT